MHPIQLEIIIRLVKHPDARYRDIRPKEIEGNRFTYHLNKLLKDNLLIKNGNKYQLTSKGLEYSSHLSLIEQKTRIQPKIVTLIVAQENMGRYLLYERKHEPFRGKTGFPYGKIHLGETIATAAERELTEKTGLCGEISHIGDAYVLSYQKKELVNHMLYHVFKAKNLRGQLIEDSDIGRCFWGDVTPSNSSQYFPGFKEIYAAQMKERYFFLEIKTL